MAGGIKIGMNARRRRGLTLLEVLFVLTALGVLAMLFLPRFGKNHTFESRIGCVNNLKNLGLAFRIWSTDHGDRFPMEVSQRNGGTLELGYNRIVAEHPFVPVYASFRALSNELSTPLILVCPADTRRAATNFAALRSNSNVSYFLGWGAARATPAMMLAGDRNVTNNWGATERLFPAELLAGADRSVGWATNIHVNNGNVVLADGSVQQFNGPRLDAAMRSLAVVSNACLLFPVERSVP